MDKDVIADFDLLHEENFNPKKDFLKVLMWFAKQVNIALRCKRLAIAEMRPGAVYGDHPTVIYIKTLRRPTYYPPSSKIGRICVTRLRFNEALNNTVAKMDNHIMNITYCNQEADFNPYRNLTPQSAKIFWQQLDSLIERFDNRKIELLPAQHQKIEAYSTLEVKQSSTQFQHHKNSY